MKTSYVIIGVAVILIVGIYFITRPAQQPIYVQGGAGGGSGSNSDLQNAAGIVGGLSGLIGSIGSIFKPSGSTGSTPPVTGYEDEPWYGG